MTRRLSHLMVSALHDLRTQAYPVANGFRRDGRGPYPLDLRSVTRTFRLGADDVAVVPGPDGRYYHNPVSVSLHALGRHALAYLDTRYPGGSDAGFLHHARYLRSSQDPNGGWRYPVPVRRYGVEPGWYSAMAQGLAISVFVRAYDATGETSYLDAADAAAVLMLRPLKAGGCADYDEGGRPFLEECPSDPPCHILNGALFALIGLCEYETRRDEGGHLAGAARRLATQLTDYDLGYWSRYDLWFTASATFAYHALHVSLLDVAARLLADNSLAYPAFGTTAVRWRSYLRHPTYRLRAAADKARFALAESRG